MRIARNLCKRVSYNPEIEKVMNELSNLDKIEQRAEAIGKEVAYPIVEPNVPCGINIGLTKLEHFAGLAMQGMICRGSGYSSTCAEDSVRLAKALCFALAQVEIESEVQNC